jgi:nicotinate phosphoribosyltransferase
MKNIRSNYTMLCDFYELTMANGYFVKGMKDKIAYFDVFFRTFPDQGGFVIAAGLEEVIKYIQNLHFTADDIEFLRSKKIFNEEFLKYLENFKFTGDIYAVPEGTVVFANEPMMIVRAPVIEAQFIETYVLTSLNYQSLIATKANRVVRASEGKVVSEFGARRAHGPESALLGARAAYIGGCDSSSNTLADRDFGVPSSGTMAHSWVEMFDDELSAFKAYCEIYPENTVLLVDTYNIEKSGIPNAIKAFNEVLVPKGYRPKGIRIDSGDIAYESKRARKMLDEAGFQDCKIVASNSLDEYLITDLILQNASVDFFGVGERLITSKSSPVLDGVYKLVAVEDEEGNITPKIKISENIGKITTPHYKKVYRLYDRETNKALADLITVYDEVIDDTKPLLIFDPIATWKQKTLTNFYARELLVPIFKGGELVYQLPTLEEIKDYAQKEVDTLWEEVKRFENPHRYYVDLSQKLWDIKNELLLAQKR